MGVCGLGGCLFVVNSREGVILLLSLERWEDVVLSLCGVGGLGGSLNLCEVVPLL